MKPRLLERLNLSHGATGDRVSHDPRREDAIQLSKSIERHLQQLLNTRHGACLSQPNLGLPLVSPLSLQGDNPQAKQLCQVIQGQIEQFEPRLTQAQLRIMDQPNDSHAQQIRYQLEAYALMPQDCWQLSYRITVDGDGIFKVLLDASQSVGRREVDAKGLMVKL